MGSEKELSKFHQTSTVAMNTELAPNDASRLLQNSDTMFDMNEMTSELDQITKVFPKGLKKMKDLDHELDDMISAMPVDTNEKLKHTRFFKKSATAVYSREGEANYSPLSKQEREAKLDTITASSLKIENKGNSSGVAAAVLLCKFIQCALWDAGFQYSLLTFQYDAVLAAAGIDVRILLDVFINWDEFRRSLLVSQCEMGEKARVEFCKCNVKFAKTRGLLLAGEWVVVWLEIYLFSTFAKW